MYKIKPLALVALVILFSGVLTSVAAQRRMPAPIVDEAPAASIDEVPLPIPGMLSGTYSITVSAIELSAGDMDFATGMTYGWTSYGKTEGDLSGFMFISMNYTQSTPPSSRGGGRSQITGGSWSKLIYIKGEYAGSVYGRIVGGELVWNETGVPANISLLLTSDAGTESFVGSAGSGNFEGQLDQSSKVPSVSGVLTLKY